MKIKSKAASVSLLFSQIRHKLFVKISIALVLIFILILVPMLIIVVGIEKRALLDEKNINAELITDMLAKISAFHIEKFSYYQLEENTLRLQSEKDNKHEILSILIFDTNGNKLNPGGLEPYMIEVPSHYWLVKEKNCEYKVSGGDTKYVGKIKVIFSLKSVEEKIAGLYIKITLVMLPILILTGFAVSYMLFYFITKPLKKLTGMAESIGKGNYDLTYETDSNDEIAFLGETFTGMCGYIRQNFAEIKRQKHEIEEYNIHLESIVEQRTAELVKAEKLASLGGLVAGIAHEINTPVGVSLTASSLMKKETKKISDLFKSKSLKLSDFETYISLCGETGDLIQKNLMRAADLINSFKQVAVDQSSEECRSFMLNFYVNEIISSIKPQFKRYSISVDIDIDEKIEINGYPGPFAQIITNLVMNSLSHGYNAGDAGIIRIAAAVENDAVVIVYSDNGKGISAENLKNIYDPFYTTKRSDGNTGLGMHIVYNIITQKFKGSIHCISEEGEGVMFTIKLPVSVKRV